MDNQQGFEQLRDFFENRPASKVAADSLSDGVEIQIEINGSLTSAFSKKLDKPALEMRSAISPDFIFQINSNAIQQLVDHKGDDIGEIGIILAKAYLAKNIRIKFVGTVWNVLTKGYLGVIKSGGPSFLKFLASHGLSGISKIKEFLTHLKK